MFLLPFLFTWPVYLSLKTKSESLLPHESFPVAVYLMIAFFSRIEISDFAAHLTFYSLSDDISQVTYFHACMFPDRVQDLLYEHNASLWLYFCKSHSINIHWTDDIVINSRSYTFDSNCLVCSAFCFLIDILKQLFLLQYFPTGSYSHRDPMYKTPWP